MEHIVTLSDRYKKLVIKDLNKVLDDYKISGKEWCIEIIIAFIQDNLFRKETTELIKRIEESPISDWNE